MGWKDEFEAKIVSADQAAALVKDGDFVSIPMGREPTSVCYALSARVGELKGVTICPAMQARDFIWYEPGWEESFRIAAPYVTKPLYQLFDERRADYLVPDILMRRDFGIEDVEGDLDVLLVTLSPPDKHGFCSFGGSVWHKPDEVRLAKTVIAEINPHQIRTFGKNHVHVSEIDYFVEHIPLDTPPATRDMTGRLIGGPGEVEKKIAGHISTLIKDGDVIMVGIGAATEFLYSLGAFEGRSDLGIHTEIISPGLINGVKSGQFNGSRKNVNKGVAVATAVGGGRDEYDFVDSNPQFELYPADYVLDPRTVADHDNMTSICSALGVDLTGQGITDSLGYTMRAGTGGQASFAIGCGLSKGGKYILAFGSQTAAGHSRIFSAFKPGTVVSVPRWLTDYVVTEYGIARLKGKSQRQRALALISIAHPDHRDELKKEALKHFWP